MAFPFDVVLESLTQNDGLGVYFLFPETSGRHLEEVDMIFKRSTSIFDTVSVSRRLPKNAVTRDIPRDEAEEKAAQRGLEPSATHQSGKEEEA